MEQMEYSVSTLTYRDAAKLVGADETVKMILEDEPLLARCIRDAADGTILAAMVFDRSEREREAALVYLYAEEEHKKAGIFKVLFSAAKKELKRSGYRSVFVRVIGSKEECDSAFASLSSARFLPVHLMGRLLTYTIADFYDSPYYSRAVPMCVAGEGSLKRTGIYLVRTADESVIIRIPMAQEVKTESAFKEYLARVLSHATTGLSMDTGVCFEVYLQKTVDRITALLGKGEEKFLQEYMYLIRE